MTDLSLAERRLIAEGGLPLLVEWLLIPERRLIAEGVLPLLVERLLIAELILALVREWRHREIIRSHSRQRCRKN